MLTFQICNLFLLSGDMRILKLFLIMFFLVILQTVLLSRLSVLGVSSDLPIAFACLAAFLIGPREGFWLGALAGFSADVFSPEKFVFAITVSLTCFVLGLLKERFFNEEDFVMFAFVFVGTFLSYLCGSWILSGLYGKEIFGTWTVILTVSLLNTLFTPYLKALIFKSESTGNGQRIKI